MPPLLCESKWNWFWCDTVERTNRAIQPSRRSSQVHQEHRRKGASGHTSPHCAAQTGHSRRSQMTFVGGGNGDRNLNTHLLVIEVGHLHTDLRHRCHHGDSGPLSPVWHAFVSHSKPRSSNRHGFALGRSRGSSAFTGALLPS